MFSLAMHRVVISGDCYADTSNMVFTVYDIFVSMVTNMTINFMVINYGQINLNPFEKRKSFGFSDH